MSTLKIINGTKPSDGCANYRIYIPVDDGVDYLWVDYTDCSDQDTYKEIPYQGGDYIEYNVCAVKDSIRTNGTYEILSETPCVVSDNFPGGQFFYDTYGAFCRQSRSNLAKYSWGWKGGFTLKDLINVSNGIFRVQAIYYSQYSAPTTGPYLGDYLPHVSVGHEYGPSDNVDVSFEDTVVHDSYGPNPICTINNPLIIRFNHSSDGGQTWGGDIDVYIRSNVSSLGYESVP